MSNSKLDNFTKNKDDLRLDTIKLYLAYLSKDIILMILKYEFIFEGKLDITLSVFDSDYITILSNSNIFIKCDDKIKRIYDSKNGKILHTLMDNRKYISNYPLELGENKILIPYCDMLQIWDVTEKSKIINFDISCDHIDILHNNHSMSYIVAITKHNTINILNYDNTINILTSLKTYNDNDIQSLICLKNNTFITVTSYNHIYLWQYNEFQNHISLIKTFILTEHISRSVSLYTMRFSPEGLYFSGYINLKNKDSENNNTKNNNSENDDNTEDDEEDDDDEEMTNGYIVLFSYDKMEIIKEITIADERIDNIHPIGNNKIIFVGYNTGVAVLDFITGNVDYIFVNDDIINHTIMSDKNIAIYVNNEILIYDPISCRICKKILLDARNQSPYSIRSFGDGRIGCHYFNKFEIYK